MLHRTIATVIAVRLILAPAAVADDARPSVGSPIADAAARAAQAAASTPPPRRPMHPGAKWTGVGLMLAPAPIALTAAIGDCVAPERRCRERRQAAYVAAGILAGSGLAVLTIAHVQRLGPEPAPDPNRKTMRPGLKWTGIGLLAGSVLGWAAAEQYDCFGSTSCHERQEARRTIAGMTAGAGVAVLATGFATRRPAWPTVVVQGDRAMLQQRISF